MIQRYRYFTDGIDERDDGELVLFCDHEAEVARLREENKRLRDALEGPPTAEQQVILDACRAIRDTREDLPAVKAATEGQP